jgi:hypothetical protein
MPKMYNVDHAPRVIVHGERAVMPGEAHDFTDEQVAAGVAGLWSEKNPRAGLAAERAFKRKRDADVAAIEGATTDINDSGEE